MAVKFTEFTLAEIQSLVEESQRAFLSSKDNPDEIISDILAFFTADPEFRIFGFEENLDPVSYIVVLGDRKRPNSLAIGPMYVSEKYRGKGLGKRQIENFISYAKEKGCTTIFTKTWGGNLASRAIFENLGFAVESIKKGDRADGDDTVNYLLYLM